MNIKIEYRFTEEELADESGFAYDETIFSNLESQLHGVVGALVANTLGIVPDRIAFDYL